MNEIKGRPFYGAAIAFLSGLYCLLPLAAVTLRSGGKPTLKRPAML